MKKFLIGAFLAIGDACRLWPTTHTVTDDLSYNKF